MNLTDNIKNAMIALFLGMSQVDKEILLNSGAAISPEQGITNPVYSRNSFLRAIQLGQLSEQQLKWFYDHLDGMDKFHRNGGAMGASLLAEGSSYFARPNDDKEPGFNEQHSFQNKAIDGSIGKSQIPTLTVLRDENRMGIIRIEDYCTEVVIKEGNGSLLAEFYCLNYKLSGTDLTEKLFDKLNTGNYNLLNFVDIKAFNVVRSTATRNAIDHSYKVKSFYKIKSVGKEFVVKFIVEELK